MKRIIMLTSEQTARMPEWVEKWVRVGLSTERADFGKAEQAVLACYQVAGLKRPQVILRMGSPYAATIGGALGVLMLGERQVRSQLERQLMSQVESQVRSQVWSQVGEQVRSQVGEQVRSQVESQVGEQVRSQVRSQLISQVEHQVQSQVWSQVEHQVRSQLERQVRSQVQSQMWSQVRSQVASQVWSQVWSQVASQVWSQVGEQVGEQVRSQVRSQVASQVWSQVWSQVESQVRSQVWSQVGEQVRSQVGEQVGSQVRSQVGEQVGSQVGSAWSQYRGCQLWAGWYSHITFFRDVCGWQDDALLAFGYDEQLALSCGWTWWNDDVCAISDRPETLVRNDRGQLHCGTGPAIRYPDGWSIWAWNGVRVTEQIIMKPHTLTPEQIATEQNAQIRQVMVERVGHEQVARMFQAKVCDRKSIRIGETVHPYELLDCVVGETRVKYLKMVNPSMGVYHIEPVGVAPRTVDEALRARQPQWMQNIPIDEVNGLTWYQQGDVYIVPDGAKSIRKYPVTLT